MQVKHDSISVGCASVLVLLYWFVGVVLVHAIWTRLRAQHLPYCYDIDLCFCFCYSCIIACYKYTLTLFYQP